MVREAMPASCASSNVSRVRVALVVPTYQEAENIEQFLRAARLALPGARMIGELRARADRGSGTATMSRESEDKAFSSEVDAGSRKENASKHESKALVLINQSQSSGAGASLPSRRAGFLRMGFITSAA